MTVSCFRKCQATALSPAAHNIRLTEAIPADCQPGHFTAGLGDQTLHPLPPRSRLFPLHHPWPSFQIISTNIQMDQCGTDIQGPPMITCLHLAKRLCLYFFPPIYVKIVSCSHSWREGKKGREREEGEKGGGRGEGGKLLGGGLLFCKDTHILCGPQRP